MLGKNNPLQNIGALLFKEASQMSKDESGDGTTSCLAIARSVLNNGNKIIRGSSVNGSAVDTN